MPVLSEDGEQTHWFARARNPRILELINSGDVATNLLRLESANPSVSLYSGPSLYVGVSIVVDPHSASKPLRMGPMAAAGDIVVSEATALPELYFSSYKIANVDSIIGTSNPGTPAQGFIGSFNTGDAVTIVLRNTGSVEQFVLLEVRFTFRDSPVATVTLGSVPNSRR